MASEEEAGEGQQDEVGATDAEQLASRSQQCGDGDEGGADEHAVGGDGEGLGVVCEANEDGGAGYAGDADGKPGVDDGVA